MPAALPVITGDSLVIRPWVDPVVDTLGHDPRTGYVERFWLGVLGPSTTWLLRRIAAGLDGSPDGFELPLSDTARALGLGGDGAHSPFVRAIKRSCQFGLARAEGPGAMGVRRKLPPLNRAQLARLPAPVQAEHEAWLARDRGTPELERMRRRSRHLALSLFELGAERETVERELLGWHIHPSLCHESAEWAWQRHRVANEAVSEAS